MGWEIQCTDAACRAITWVPNIVDLITSHRDPKGWLLCQCGKPGYIEKSFQLQEEGETWAPYLRGIIPLGASSDTYQPFVFLVSYGPEQRAVDVWFAYYKDLRGSGGRLKLGYGPGGPPVLGKANLLDLLGRLVEVGYLSREEVVDSLGSPHAL